MLEKSNACWLLKTNYLLCFHKVKYSFLLDIKLIFKTVKILFMSESTEGFTDNSIPNANSCGQPHIVDDTVKERENKENV